MKPTETDSLSDKAVDLGHDVVEKAGVIADEARESLGKLADEARDEASEKMSELSKKAKEEYSDAMKSPKKRRAMKMVGVFLAGWLFGIIIAALMGGFSHGKDRDMNHMMQGEQSMTSSMHMMNEGLKGLSGADLEKKFLEDMIIHHNGAIDMASSVLNDAKNIQHSELIQLSTGIIKAQTAEVALMKGWLASWYPAQ